MYTVTQDFIDKMCADKRQVIARAYIDYTDPFLDQSIQISANEKANISYPQQTADSIDIATHKWAALDGTWDLTSGEYHLAPSDDKLSQYQFGWWGAQFAGEGGAFTSPYPTLTITHVPRPIRQLKVVGDSARQEYPVDFSIKLYAQDGTLLRTETITGNKQVGWQKDLNPQILDVAKQELIITKWSHAGRCAKIIEFFTSIREVYETGDLMSLNLLEEREASQGSLPIGNISANEIMLSLNNESKKFSIDNEQSPLKNLLKPNRRIQAWLGAEAENAAAKNPPTFTRDSVAYQSDGTQVAANIPRFEPGKFGKAIMVEEGTINLHPNPLMNVDSNSDGIVDGFSSETYNCSPSRSLDGGQKITMGVATVSYAYAGVMTSTYIPVSAGATYTLSVEAKLVRSAAETVELVLIWFDTNNAVISSNGLYEQNPGADYKRLSLTVTAPANAAKAKVALRIRASSISDTGSAWFRRVQLEAKPYPTSFIDGTRSPETLTIPTAGVLNPQEGTIECWAYNSLLFSSKTGVIFDVKGANGDRMYLEIGINHQLKAVTYISGQVFSAVSSPLTLGWHYVAMTWDSNSIICYVDGKMAATRQSPQLLDSAVLATIGSTTASSYHFNSFIDDLRISNRARTDEEILAAYQSNKPLHRDEHTTYLLSFNGSIYPVEQCWVPLGTFWSLDWDSPDDTLEATVSARDRMELLRKGTYQTSQVQINKSLYELAELVLQDAGLNSNEYIIDTALRDIVIPYAWFESMSHREALRRIAEAGLAAVYADRDGKIRIESFILSGETADLEITENDYFKLNTPSKQSDIANEIIVDTQPLRPSTTPEEVYKSNEPITIPANTIKTITAFYNKQPVIEAAASLDNPPTNVSIVEATYYGWGSSIKIRNTNTTDQQVTLIITGKPLSIQNKERAIARDEASILENGVLTYEFPTNTLVQTLSQAQAIADALLASVKDSRRDVEIDWRGNPALLLGDRVTVKGKDYYIIRQELDWQGYLSARLTGRKA